MRVYVIIDTSYEGGNGIVGVFSSEILAKEYRNKYFTPVDGIMSDDDKFFMSLARIEDYEVDIKFYDVFNPTED
jgi:hypothetical protein